MGYLSFEDRTLRVGNIWLSNVSRPKNYRHSFRKGRTKHGFIYTVSGQMRDIFSTSKKDDLCVGEGEVIFIPKGTVYTGIYERDNTEIKIVQFDLLSGELPEYLSKPCKITIPGADKLIEAFFEPVEKRISGCSFYHLSRLYELLWRIDESEVKIPAKYKKLKRAVFEMKKNWNQSPPVSYYSDLCGMSQVHFRRLFKEYSGFSPVDYRNRLRLEESRRMLQSGEYNVSEVAALCGFSGISFFTKSYKNRYGYSPSEE